MDSEAATNAWAAGHAWPVRQKPRSLGLNSQSNELIGSSEEQARGLQRGKEGSEGPKPLVPFVPRDLSASLSSALSPVSEKATFHSRGSTHPRPHSLPVPSSASYP